MKIQVKAVEGNTQKSKAEIEEKLLKDHEEKLNNESSEKKVEQVEEPVNESVEEKVESTPEQIVEKETPSSELSDEDVLSYIKNRYDKDISSVNELFETKESNPELPEDDSVLADYISTQEDGLDAIDIQDIMDDKFGFNEEEDEERDIKRKKLAKKRELAKAKKFFKEQKDKYKIPLESSGGGLSEEQEKDLSAYKKYIEESKTDADGRQKRYDYFLNKTNEVFNSEFKGFEFSVGEDKKINYKPGTAEELKNNQSDVNKFVSKFMGNDGLIADPKGYHRALSVAMNPEKFAKFFYEQGVAATVDNVARKSKNINMDVRRAPQLSTKDSLKIRPVGDTSSGRGLKIRSIKKV